MTRNSIRVCVLLTLAIGIVSAGCANGLHPSRDYNPYAYHALTPDQQAQRLIWDGEYRRAALVLEKYGHICEGATMHTLLGEAYLRSGRFEDAAREYHTAVDLPEFWDDSTWVDPRVRVLISGDSDAENCLKAAFDGGQIRAGKLLEAAEAMLRAGDYNGASEMCDAICAEGLVTDPHMLMARGEAEFQLRDLEAARRDFRLALESLDEEHARKRLMQIERMQVQGVGETPAD